MKSDTSNDLYVLQGTTITSNITIVVNQSQDKILLWHLVYLIVASSVGTHEQKTG